MMLVERIANATNVLGAPEGWNQEDRKCGRLPVRIERDGELLTMTSAWSPTPDELARLNKGAPVLLRIVGASHPPVMLYVGDAPE